MWELRFMFQHAVKRGDTEVVDCLLEDGRVDADSIRLSFRDATTSGVIKRMLPRADFDLNPHIDHIRSAIDDDGDQELARTVLTHSSIECLDHLPKTCFLREVLREMTKTNRESVFAYIRELTDGIDGMVIIDTRGEL